MCGIAGVINDKNIDNLIINNIGKSLKHRGPDNYDYWQSNDKAVSLVHTRLSIQDLSSNGNQPMQSSSGRYVIIFNGEIYNHLELRNKLLKEKIFLKWKSSSDTETIIQLIETYGFIKTLDLIKGMFAFCVFDKKENRIFLARDKIGEKPLYYGKYNDIVMFASELKAFKANLSFKNEIDRNSISTFMYYGKIPAPLSIFKNVYKLLPGSYLEFNVSDKINLPKPKLYWSYQDTINYGNKNIFKGSANDAVNQLEYHLSNAVNQQQISDVEIGAFLSGGIDSSLIVAIMQKQSSKKIKTYTIGTDDIEFDESISAKETAKILGTEHKQLIIGNREIINAAKNIANMYDEPFADSSQVPTYLVSKLAREDVKVCMSGDAGDEIFGGYNRYIWTQKIINIPHIFRILIKSPISIFSENSINKLGYMWSPVLPSKFKVKNLGEKIKKVEKILGLKSEYEIYKSLIVTDGYNPNIVINGNDQYSISNYFNDFRNLSLCSRLMAVDVLTYLPDDILCKVDRAAMSVSLETRIPFLDEEIMKFASSLPYNFKFRQGKGKWILRELLKKYLPEKLINRPKTGFAVPIGDWIRGPLKEWSLDLLSESQIKRQGYLNHRIVNQITKEHFSKEKNWNYMMWNMLMFQSWLEI